MKMISNYYLESVVNSFLGRIGQCYQDKLADNCELEEIGNKSYLQKVNDFTGKLMDLEFPLKEIVAGEILENGSFSYSTSRQPEDEEMELYVQVNSLFIDVLGKEAKCFMKDFEDISFSVGEKNAVITKPG